MGDPDPATTPPSADPSAVSLGVSIDARDERGAPRLVRAVIPRRSAAGMTSSQAARDHVAALAPLWVAQGRPSTLVERSEQRLRNGATIVRLQQQINGVDLHHGELRVMVKSDGALAAVAGTLRATGARTEFKMTAAAAVERGLDTLYGPNRARPTVVEGADKAGYRSVEVGALAKLQVHTARAKRELMPQGDQLIAIWNVEITATVLGFDDRPESAARRYLIADSDGRVMSDINLTASDAFVYRVFADSTGDRRPFDGALQSYNPHPAGFPDGTQPPFAAQNLVVMDSFNGPRDPWLPANATTTTGNNVDSYADIALPVGFGPGDIRPVVRGGRTLNYTYDFTAEPLATPSQSMASAVNAFYVTNWLHDWYYDSGFTESAGNAQTNNFGRGGVEGDPLVVHAQAGGSLDFRDNANMTTPADGESPVMNMFLWTGRAIATLATPTANPEATTFDFTPRNFELSGELVVVDDLEGDGHDACRGIAPIPGKIAFVKFSGSCSSESVVANVAFAGAIGIVAMIDIPGEGPIPLRGDAGSNLPGVVIGYHDGLALEAEAPAFVTLGRTTSIERDGDFDNAIIAHEWGHYLHHRLSLCEAHQCAAMSEGWGDFVALHLMLRETDNREGTYGMGNYALGAGGLLSIGHPDPGYFGIRRYPYSIDRTKNALSFRHIGDDHVLPDTPTNPGPVSFPNSEVHNAGEVWTAMMWEVYNIIIDQHGYREARRRMSDYIVSGLLLTPPNASFTEARDAILAAAAALDTDDMLLMAAAFAGRGAGTCAVSPPPSSSNLSDLVESGTVAARLAIGTPTLTDDGTSCDRDGFLDPGETGLLRLTIANNGTVAAENLVTTATTTTPGITLGKPVVLPSLAPLSQIDVAIPVTVSLAAPVNSSLAISVSVDSDAGCNTGHLTASIQQVMGIDEELGVSRVDDFQTKLVAWTPTGESASELWRRTSDGTGNHVMFGTDAGFLSDTQLVSPVLHVSPTETFVVSVTHAFSLEAIAFLDRYFDGGIIELTNDGGATWRDVAELGVDPGYTGELFDSPNPLAGRRAFSGQSPGYPNLVPLTLVFGTQFAGQDVQLRFRIGTDLCCNASGWTLDNISVVGTTNAPFPGIVSEPTRCRARSAGERDSGAGALRSMPRATLTGVAVPDVE